MVRVYPHESKRVAGLFNVAPKYGVEVSRYGVGGFIGQKYMLVMNGSGHDIYRWLRLWHIRPSKNAAKHTWASRREEHCHTR